MSEVPSLPTILMADDDADDRLLATEAFAAAAVRGELRFVRDGDELLDYLRRRGTYASPGAAPTPAFILLDLNMPRKDGREALAEIKSDPKLCAIPVVVLTTSRASTDVRRTYELGASTYVVKPDAFGSLVEVMRTLAKYWLEIAILPSGGRDGRPS